MARPLRIEYPGAFYHIIQRGNERSDIFKSDEDRKKFLEYTKITSERYNIKIHTYCLMSNHYHLIVETKDANLARAMHSLHTSYTVYFNTKRKRSGHLFQGRYKAILVQADAYLHHLSRYIHLNPVRIKMVKEPDEYSWSSYKFFTSEAKSPDWLRTDFILSIFDKDVKKAKNLYRKFVVEYIGDEADIIRDNVTAGLLGKESFIEWVRSKFIENRKDTEIPDIEKLRKRPGLRDIAGKVEKVIGDKSLARKIGIYLSRKHTGKQLKEIANFYGRLGDTGVSQLCIRLDEKRKDNKQLNILINRVEKEIGV